MNFDMEERIERLERLVEAQQTQLDYLKNELKEMYDKLEWKIRTSSMPIDYNPCR
jgi:chaperonin cofactor prefoldin